MVGLSLSLKAYYFRQRAFWGEPIREEKEKKKSNALNRLALLLLGVMLFMRWAQWRILVEQRPVLAMEAAELRRQQLALNLFGVGNGAMEMTSTTREPAPMAPPPNFIQQPVDVVVDFKGTSEEFLFKTIEYNPDSELEGRK